MPETVECDMLGNPCRFNPFLERLVDVGAFELPEHEAGGPPTTELVRLISQGQGGLRIRLLCPYPYAPSAVLSFFYITPSESKYIADTQSGKDAEQ